MSTPDDREAACAALRPLPSARPTLRAVFLVQRVLGALFILLIVILIATEVFLRTAFSITLGFAHEVSGYLLVGAAFVGFAIALADGKLFRIELIYTNLKPRPQVLLQLAFDTVSLVFSLVLLRYLVAFVISSHQGGYSSSTSLAAPLYLPQMAMPLGIALVCLSLSVRIVDGLCLLGRRQQEAGR